MERRRPRGPGGQPHPAGSVQAARALRATFEAAGLDPGSPEAERIAQLHLLGKHDLAEKLLRPYRALAAQRALRGRRFAVRTDLPREGVHLGTSTDQDRDGGEAWLPMDRHVLVCGVSGSGKSTLMLYAAEQLLRSGRYTVQIIDPEDEFGPPLLSRFPREELLPLLPQDVKVNPFQVPQGFTPKAWVARLCDLLSVYFAQDGLGLIRRAAEELYFERGVLRGGERWPAPRDVQQRLESYKFAATSKKARYLETALKIAEVLTGRMGETFDVRESIPVATLAKQSFILSVGDLGSVDLEFFLALFLELTTGTRERPRVLIFDEAHIVLNRFRANRLGLKEPPLEEAARRLRKRWTILIVVDQAPALLPPAVQSNFASVITLRMPNYHDRVFVGSAIGLNQDETAYLAKLPPRHGVVSSQALRSPVLFRAPDLSFSEAPDPEIVRGEVEEILREKFSYGPVPAPWSVGAAESGSMPGVGESNDTTRQSPVEQLLMPMTGGIKGPALNYLANQARDPLMPVTVFDRMHEYSAAKGHGLRNQLVEAGLEELLEVTTGGRGGKVKVPWITEPGYRVLREMEFAERKPKGLGSPEARFWAYAIYRSERRNREGATVGIEMARNGKAVDVGVECEEGLIAYEIQLSEPTRHATENLTRDLMASFTRVVFCAKRDEDLAAIRRKVEGNLGNDEKWKEALACVEYRLLRSFL